MGGALSLNGQGIYGLANGLGIYDRLNVWDIYSLNG